MSARVRSLSIMLASLATLSACSSSSSPTSPDVSTVASGSATSTGGTTTSTGGASTSSGGNTSSPVPTIVARVDSTTSVNNGTSYYPSWETVWYVGGHKLFAFVPTARKSFATRIHSSNGAIVAGECVTATYVVSGAREYAQDITLEAASVCH